MEELEANTGLNCYRLVNTGLYNLEPIDLKSADYNTTVE
jgi:hypothetical protein